MLGFTGKENVGLSLLRSQLEHYTTAWQKGIITAIANRTPRMAPKRACIGSSSTRTTLGHEGARAPIRVVGLGERNRDGLTLWLAGGDLTPDVGTDGLAG